MEGHSCIQNTAEIFPASTGGAQAMSKELNVEFLGSIPLDPLLARCCDEGKNFLTEMSNSPTVNALNEICKRKTLTYFVKYHLTFFTQDIKKIVILFSGIVQKCEEEKENCPNNSMQNV